MISIRLVLIIRGGTKYLINHDSTIPDYESSAHAKIQQSDKVVIDTFKIDSNPAENDYPDSNFYIYSANYTPLTTIPAGCTVEYIEGPWTVEKCKALVKDLTFERIQIAPAEYHSRQKIGIIRKPAATPTTRIIQAMQTTVRDAQQRISIN
jgi:hypothetical protein